MMKQLWMVSSIFLIAGCSSISTEKTSNTGVRGLLICEINEICPIVTVAWNESFKDALKIKMSLSSTYQQYDLHKVILTDGTKTHSFNVSGPTENDYAFGSYRSRNSIQIPINLIADFSDSENVSMNIYTDHGVISRYILKGDVKAPIFEELIKAYK